MSATEDVIKVVANPDTPETTEIATTKQNEKGNKTTEAKAEPKKVQAPRRVRSKKYATVRSRVDKTRRYSVVEAVTAIKKLSYSKFDGTITLDGVAKEVGKVATITLPHTTGKTVRVAIVDDAVLADIEAGKINFDILITAPQYMPKLAKFARILGPKGLMPNPKNGTVTPKPEIKKAELEKGAFDLRTEKKAPVIHVLVGKVSMNEKALIENIEAIMTVAKGRLLSASISATMSPSIKLEIIK